ncbi:MAG: alcohol dehydrogenase catalytic domain-containing protein, partial [Burkholderiaceae bacterium]
MISYQVTSFGGPLQKAQVDTPAPQGSEVLLKVLAAGVCHTDIHTWHGSYDLGGGKRLSMQDRGVTLPLTLGHEIVG